MLRTADVPAALQRLLDLVLPERVLPHYLSADSNSRCWIEGVPGVDRWCIGGENVATTVEGRERYPINVRYLADYRNDLEALRRISIMTRTGAQTPLGEVAHIDLSPGPSMIRDENGLLTGYVYVDLATSDYGTYVNKAQLVLDRRLRPPAG